MATTAPPGAAAPMPALSEPRTALRHRKTAAAASVDYRADDEREPADTEDDDKSKDHVEVNWGKTPSGEVFRVPETHSFVHTLLHTFTRSSLTRWTTFSLVAQPALFFLLAGYPTLRSVFFLVYFAFWRAAYDFGFAWILRRQSEKKWVVRTLRQWGWLDTNSGNEEGRAWARWWKRELEMKMGEGYTWESVPQEYNAWLIFRQLVDIVLLNDFVSYSLFAWANLNFPANQGPVTHVLRWILGWSLIVFNLWVKMDAHRVVKDYAWYWGDAFWLMVMQHDLVFDGVYEIAPHPMYSVGYAGYYGLSIVVGSYTVLFVSLAAHAAQFAFLLWFENPHIDRTYGGAKKPLAARVPLETEVPTTIPVSAAPALATDATAAATNDALVAETPTPPATEGETETEPEIPDLPEQEEPAVHIRSNSSISSASNRALRSRALSTTMHDLTHRFFRKPVVILSRIDPFRATDFALILLSTYALFSLIPALPPKLGLAAHFLHALLWRTFHSYGLGLLLRAQSKTKWYIRHFLHTYSYPGDTAADRDEELGEAKTVVRRATEEAFQNWQVGYNISLVMTYISFAGLAWKTYHLPSDWTISGTILRHVLGAALVALHVWSAVSIHEVLGDFGWFYSDFFLFDQVPSRLAYTGIYRFLNNPERTLGGAAFLGLALISNSRLVLTLAIFSHLSHWWFLSFVERPHMERLYGDRLRKDGGLTKTVKSMGKTLANKKSMPEITEIKRYVDEVRDSVQKVEYKVHEAVEDFIEHARPRFAELVDDTKSLIEKSREKMTITRVAKDLSAYDTSRYSITVASSSSSAANRFHVGQPIRVSWTAPSNHSRKDWIGIYRLGSAKSKLITKISSKGKWVPIFEEEYEGEEQAHLHPAEQVSQGDAGIATFRGNRLPWAPGQYELRYHHDGKHNVMSVVSPIEIYVNKPQPAEMHSYPAVHDTLLNIVCLALDANPALVPRSARKLAKASVDGHIASPPSSSSGLPSDAPVRSTLPLDAGVAGVRSGVPSEAGTAWSSSSGLPSPPQWPRSLPDEPAGSHSPSPIPTRSANSIRSPALGIVELAAELHTEDSMSGSASAAGGNHDADEPLDPDDFVIMDETQAKRIMQLCEWTFGVELSQHVVVADANVRALARRVLGARKLIDGAIPIPDAVPTV